MPMRRDGSAREDGSSAAAARLSSLLAELAAPPVAPEEAADWTAEDLRPGERLDRFEIRGVLGRGGFGTVYEAWDGELARTVALKTLRPARGRASPSASMRHEAEAVAKLNHPCIVTIHDVCRGEGGYCLVMERLQGETLAQRLSRGALPWKEALRIAADVADALRHAHGRGVLHRDLKPANVFLCDDGRVKLLDFGLAHLLGDATSPGGTPAYMAPEQARGDRVDARVDVFALGVVIAEMITGAAPGAAAHPSHGHAPRWPGAPARLSRLVSRMRAYDPAARPSSGVEVASELAALRRVVEQRRWRTWAAATIALAAVVASLGLVLRPARLPPGRLVVAMADLDNRTDDRELDGVGLLFGAALEQSRRVSLMDRQTLARAVANAGVSPRTIAESDAVAAARASRAQLVVAPSLRPGRGGLELAVNVIEEPSGRVVLAARETAVAPATLYAAADRLAARVRKALGEDVTEAPRNPAPVAAFAPARPEALQAYVEGERLNAAYEYAEAQAHWERAVALDPSFPLPRLSLLQGTTGTFSLVSLSERAAREHARALRRDLARLPEALRPWAETLVVKVEGGYANHTEYVAALDKAIAARPEQPAPYVAAANALLIRRGDAHAARPYVDRAVQLAPIAGLGDVIDYLIVTDRLDEALEQARAWVEKSPTATAYMNLAAVHAARGELKDALDVLHAADERWKTGVGLAAVYVDADAIEALDASADDPLFALRGRLREALRALEARSFPAAPALFLDDDPRTRDAPTRRATLLVARGDPAEIEAAVAEAIRVAGPSPMHAWLLAEAGDVAAAANMSRYASDQLLEYRLVRALRAWKTGDPEAALAELTAMTWPVADQYRGEILAELGRHREALDAYRRYRRLRYGATSSPARQVEPWLLPRSMYLEATSLDALGRRDEARQAIARLLRLWSHADPDLPLLVKAKALERRLRGG